MRHLRSLCFESLEERKLLSRAHFGAHVRPAVTATSLVLTGTLRVHNNAATTSTDAQGDVMTSTPVVGQLGTMGPVRGTWNETSGQYGDYMGPDTLQLHTSKGSFIVAFSAAKDRFCHPSCRRCDRNCPPAARRWRHPSVRPTKREWHDRAYQQPGAHRRSSA